MTPSSGRPQADPPPRLPFSPRTARIVDRALIGAAVVLGLVGVFVLLFHLVTDPLVDIHAYYDAATRLNHGLPLYTGQVSVNDPEYYRYPPLLAILFRPLALLSFTAAALIWEAVTIAALIATIWLLGFRRRRTWIALGILAGPIAWSVTIGQAQVLVTLLLLIGNPFAVALATQLKLLAGARRGLLAGPPRLAEPRPIRGLEPRPGRGPARARAERDGGLPGQYEPEPGR